MLNRSVRIWIIASPPFLRMPPVMVSSLGALLRFSLFIDASTFHGSMYGGSMVEAIVGLPCESWSSEALLALYSST